MATILFELLSTVSMSGIAVASYYYQHKSASNDHERIIEIAKQVGLKTSGKKGETLRIFRKHVNKDKGYIEYVYKMPLGLSFHQFESKKQAFIDGLNNKSRLELRIPSLAELKAINLSGLRSGDYHEVIKQITSLYQNRITLNKHLEIKYDGMLKFRVYERGLEKMIEYNDELLSKVKNWQFPIGYSHDGLIIHDFEQMQMMVIAGMTRYGKTVALKNIITTLIHNEPENVEFTLIDLKGGLAFSRFANCKQVLTVAKNASETIQALEAIHDDMLLKQERFLENNWEDIGEAGYKKRHFVIIDEGAEIAGFQDKYERERCTYLVGEIARIGAGLSYRMVFATQYPTADVFPRTVKSNTSASLSFRLKTATQSTVVLDREGAEKLPVGLRGRAIYQSDRDIVVQTPFIHNNFIDDKIKIHIRPKNNGSNSSLSSIHKKKGADEHQAPIKLNQEPVADSASFVITPVE